MNNSRKPNPETELTVNGVAFTHQSMFDVIDDFYTRIQKDPALQIPFKSVHDWPEHIERLTHFWWTRFGGQAYMFAEYNPPLKHFHAGFNDELLHRWIEIFTETLKDHLKPEQVKLWGLIALRMGESLSMKNEYLKQTMGRPNQD